MVSGAPGPPRPAKCQSPKPRPSAADLGGFGGCFGQRQKGRCLHTTHIGGGGGNESGIDIIVSQASFVRAKMATEDYLHCFSNWIVPGASGTCPIVDRGSTRAIVNRSQNSQAF